QLRLDDVDLPSRRHHLRQDGGGGRVVTQGVGGQVGCVAQLQALPEDAHGGRIEAGACTSSDGYRQDEAARRAVVLQVERRLEAAVSHPPHLGVEALALVGAEVAREVGRRQRTRGGRDAQGG